MEKIKRISDFLFRQPLWRILAGLGVVILAMFLLKGSAGSKDFGTTFIARRGPLEITVLEGGSIEAKENGEIKCEIKGGQGVKILKIVEEGYEVAEDDVKTNKVLVELDSSDLRKQITQQEITFESTAASLIDAQQTYEIQLNQNLSDVMAAKQKARFTRMDFDKYMGDQAAKEVIAQLNVQTETAHGTTPQTNLFKAAETTLSPVSESQSNAPALSQAPGQIPANSVSNAQAAPELAAPIASSATIDLSKYTNIDLLGDGEAKQKLRELQDALQVAQKELQQAQSTVDGTKRLHEKGFVTKIEFDRDQLAYENSLLKVKKAETALNLFQKYEFTKTAEETLSRYTEALRELDRTRKGAISKLAQAEAKLKSAQAKYSLEERQLSELHDQLEKCAIKAPRSGLVVYGTGGEARYWRGEEQIREGATVRERQTIITIPDMSQMCLKVKIHESYIKKVKKGQKVTVTADAFPDRKLEGEVTQVGVLPDSENTWLNPDMKVYRTTIEIKGQHDWVKPGMSAKAEILINHLNDVVHVPIQSVHALEEKKVCYVVNGNKPEQREVQTGEFNDEFIQIISGIKEGEEVCLRAPVGVHENQGGKEIKGAPTNEENSKGEEKMASAGN